MAKELYDACDQAGNPLGYALVRGEPIPQGVWHLVAEVFSVTIDGRVLVTRRHPDKSWGGYWEYTGGSVLAGERPREAARRELLEETGIAVSEEELHPVYVESRRSIEGYPCIYHSFFQVFDPAEQAVRLQEGETVDFRLLPYGDFLDFIRAKEFVEPIRRRFLDHQGAFDRLVEAYVKR